MPGRHVTDHQMRLFMKYRQTHSVEVAAAKASISRATAFRIEKEQRLPSQNKPPAVGVAPIRLSISLMRRSFRSSRLLPAFVRSPFTTRCCGVIRNCPKAFAAHLSGASGHGGPFTVRHRR